VPARLHDLVLSSEPERRASEIDEASLVLEERGARRAALRGRPRRVEILGAVPPELGDPIEGFGGAPDLADGVGQGAGVGVQLDIPRDPERRRVGADERAVDVEPVALEFFAGQVGQTPHTERELYHAGSPFDFGLIERLRFFDVKATVLAAALLLGLLTASVVRAQGPVSLESFHVEWTTRTDAWVKPGIDGYVYNNSIYRVSNVRLRVETLDQANQPISERFSWVYGNIDARGRGHFVLPPPQAGGTYRITVVSCDPVAKEYP
jgi:hypothetical protein